MLGEHIIDDYEQAAGLQTRCRLLEEPVGICAVGE